jgi:acyl carrier protein
MTKEELLKVIKEEVGEQFGIDETWFPHRVSLCSNFKKDLNADELDMVELTMELEDKLGICIDDEDADKWKTVGDVFSYLCKKMDATKQVVVTRYDLMDFED